MSVSPVSLSLSISRNESEEDDDGPHSSAATTEDEHSDLLDELIGPVGANRPMRSDAVGSSHQIFKHDPVQRAATSAASAAATARVRARKDDEIWAEEQRMIAENEAKIEQERADEIRKRREAFKRLSKDDKRELDKRLQAEEDDKRRVTWAQAQAEEYQRVTALQPALPSLPDGAIASRDQPLSLKLRKALNTDVSANSALAALNKRLSPRFDFMHPAVFKYVDWNLPLTADQDKPRMVVWCQKLDGNRVLWDGFTGTFYSKSMKKSVKPPSQWLQYMPRNVSIDGELYLPADDARVGTETEFKSNMHHVAKVWTMSNSLSSWIWDKLEFHAFDMVGSDEVLETAWINRDALLRNLTREGQMVLSMDGKLADNYHFKRVQHYYLKEGSLKQVYAQIAQAMSYVRCRGGEGIILKEVSSRSAYLVGATSNLWLKLKFYQDGEARVISRFKNKEGLPGVMVQLSNGIECGIVHALHKLLHHSAAIDKLPRGTIVSIQYHAVEASGQLREAKITGVHTPAEPRQQNLEEWKRITGGKAFFYKMIADDAAQANARKATDAAAAHAWDYAELLEDRMQ